jgi:hypothetical protein
MLTLMTLALPHGPKCVFLSIHLVVVTDAYNYDTHILWNRGHLPSLYVEDVLHQSRKMICESTLLYYTKIMDLLHYQSRSICV